LASWPPFDLVLLLLPSNAVQNSMNGGDNLLVGGLSAVTPVALNYGVGYATFKSKKLEALIEGRPQVIIHNGKVFEDVMRSAKLTHHELSAALRRSGCACAEKVQMAILENNGSISIVQRAAPRASSSVESNA
jgi:uncharacterized membrane protein YcaP (DUF421 family)